MVTEHDYAVRTGDVVRITNMGRPGVVLAMGWYQFTGTKRRPVYMRQIRVLVGELLYDVSVCPRTGKFIHLWAGPVNLDVDGLSVVWD